MDVAQPPSPSQTAPANGGVPRRHALVLSLRWYLVALAGAVMLPLLILATVEARDAIQARESSVQLQMRLLLVSAAKGVDQGLEALTATVRTLATSPSLAIHDLALFRQEADDLASTRGMDVVLRDPTGAQLVATRVPAGTPSPTLPPEDRLARPAVASGQAYVSDVYTSGMTHPFLTRITVPARVGTNRAQTDKPGAAFALEVAFTAETVARWVQSSGLPPGWFILILGRNGQIVARYPNSEEYIGRGTAAEMFGEVVGLSGEWQGFSLEGKPLTGVYTRLETGWTVVVGAPDWLLAQAEQSALLWLGAAAVPLLLGGLITSLLLAARINGSVSTLTRTARAIGKGRTMRPIPLPVRDLAFVQDALCTAARDIADRRVKERVLLDDVRRGHDLLQAVVDGSSDLIFARDNDNRLVLANQASAALLGLASGTDAEGQLLDSTNAAALAGAKQGSMAAVDGRMFEVSHSVLRGQAGDATGMISIARDVTGRMAADSRLQRLQSDLARAGRLSAVAAMGAGLAHELHQPLSAAANFLAVAMRRLTGPGTAPVADAMAEASAQVLRTGEIVKRLRGFIGEAAMQEVGLAPLVREAAEAAWRHAGPIQGRLHFTLDETLDALADPVSIQQVVSNLVRNALEAMGDETAGDVWVVLERAADGSAMVSVLDSGPGLDSKTAEQLFDVFGGSDKPEGLGVGLAICRTIVSAHGGWITAANHSRGGAAFMFTLPPRPPTLAASTPGRQAA